MPSVTSTTAEEQNDVEQKKWNALKRYIIRERQRKKEEYEAEVEEERLRKEREARERQDVMTLGAGSGAAGPVVSGANNVWTWTVSDMMQPSVYQQNLSAYGAASPFFTAYGGTGIVYPTMVPTMPQPPQPTMMIVPSTHNTQSQSLIPLPRWLLEFSPQIGRDFEALIKLKLMDEGFTLEDIWECVRNYTRQNRAEPREPTRKEIACINFWKRNEDSLIRSISRWQSNPGAGVINGDVRWQFPQQSLPPCEQVADSSGVRNQDQIAENTNSDSGQDGDSDVPTTPSAPPQPPPSLNDVSGHVNPQLPLQNMPMAPFFAPVATYITAAPNAPQSAGFIMPNVVQDPVYHAQPAPMYLNAPMPVIIPSNPPTTNNQPSPRFPYIVIKKFPNWVQHFRALKEKLGRTPNAQSFGQGVRFTPVDSFELSLIQLYLTSLKETEKLSWTVHTPPAKGSIEVAILGLPSGTAPVDVEEELRNLGFTPEYAHVKKGRGRRPDTLLVTLKWQDNLLNRIQEIHELLCFPGIKIEIRRWKKRPVQSQPCKQCRRKLQNNTCQKKRSERRGDCSAHTCQCEREDSPDIQNQRENATNPAQIPPTNENITSQNQKEQKKTINFAAPNSPSPKNRPSLKNRMKRHEKRSPSLSPVTHVTATTQTYEPYSDDETDEGDEDVQRPIVAHVPPYSQETMEGRANTEDTRDTRVTDETLPNVGAALPAGEEETKEQIDQLEQKLKQLEKEKQQLFMQLKKVLNEDEIRKRQQQKETNEQMQQIKMPMGNIQMPMFQMPPSSGQNEPPPSQGRPPPLTSHMLNKQTIVRGPIQSGVKRTRSPSPTYAIYHRMHQQPMKHQAVYPDHKVEDGRMGRQMARAVLWNKPSQYGSNVSGSGVSSGYYTMPTSSVVGVVPERPPPLLYAHHAHTPHTPHTPHHTNLMYAPAPQPQMYLDMLKNRDGQQHSEPKKEQQPQVLIGLSEAHHPAVSAAGYAPPASRHLSIHPATPQHNNMQTAKPGSITQGYPVQQNNPNVQNPNMYPNRHRY